MIFEKFKHTDFHNIKIVWSLKDTVRKYKQKPQTSRKTAKYLTKDPYLEYI